MNKKIIDIFKYIFIVIFMFISVYFIYRLYKLNMIKELYIFLIGIFTLLILGLLIWKLLSKKSKLVTKIIVCTITVIVGTIYLVSTKYINTTIHFVKNMTNITYETQNYSVFVLNETNYKEIKDLSNKNIGFLSTNINLKSTEKALNKKIKITYKEYEDIGSLIGAIYNKEVDGIVIDDAYISLLEENEVEFYKESKVIYNYDVRIEKKDIRKKVDIKKDPFILYISGSDSRGKISDVARSDVNIVAVINPKKNKILLVSTPRDYYVQLHGTTGMKDKLTHAGVYGIEKSKTTMEDLLDIDINYYAKVGFTTVINVVDVIDGVEIDSDKAFKPWGDGRCYIKKGKQLLDGKCALAFARERHAYIEGDRHRGENQQAVLTAIIQKLSNPKYLTRYNKILKSIDGAFDTDLTYEEITTMVKYQLSELKKWEVESISLDGTSSMQPTYSMGSMKLYVMIPNQKTIDNAKAKIKEYLEVK